MRKSFLLLPAVILSTTLFAQSPEKISYQAVIRNANNQLVVDQQVGVKISILKGSDPSSAIDVYSELHLISTNSNGLITLEIGTGVTSEALSTIDWSSGTFFIKTETDPAGGNNYSLTGTSQLLSVPYALYAKESGSSLPGPQGIPGETGPQGPQGEKGDPGVAFDDASISNNLTWTSSKINSELELKSNSNHLHLLANEMDAGFLSSEDKKKINRIEEGAEVNVQSDWSATEGGAQILNKPIIIGDLDTDAGNKRIKNIADPIESQDAATKGYVTLRVSTSGDTLFLGTNQWIIIPGISVANIDPNGSVIDGDNNTYHYVLIGTQVWLTENLKTTKYNDGDLIPRAISGADWSNLSSPGYCWYNNDEINKETYGALYNWYTVNTDRLCPVGWHVPSDTDWNTLVEFLGGASVAGGKLKESGTEHWRSPNGYATNEVGYWALPGGYRGHTGGFYSLSIYAGFWSSNEPNNLTGRWWYISSDYGNISNDNSDSKGDGFSVRCIRD